MKEITVREYNNQKIGKTREKRNTLALLRSRLKELEEQHLDACGQLQGDLSVQFLAQRIQEVQHLLNLFQKNTHRKNKL